MSGTADGLEFLSVQSTSGNRLFCFTQHRRDAKCQRAIIKWSGRQISIKQNSGLER